jgi:hypothetical protein
MSMEPRWIVVTVVIILAILVDAWLLVRRRRSERLRDQFGPEYRRAVHKFGSVTRAESELEARRKRVQRLEIAPLRPEQAQRFAAAWRTTQARFVDDPDHTIAEADRLVQELMRVRGYPVVDFEQRVADISVDHPHVVEHYRAAHDIAEAAVEGRTNTEDLRQAMVHYRALFEDLLEVREELPRADLPRADEVPKRMEGGRR